MRLLIRSLFNQIRRPTPLPSSELNEPPLSVLAMIRGPWLDLLLVRGKRERVMAYDMVVDHKSALARTGHNRYDVILLEHAPELESIQLCHRFREIGMTSPILMVASSRTVSDPVAGLNGGADGYVVGPIDYEEFLCRLRVLLRLDMQRLTRSSMPKSQVK